MKKSIVLCVFISLATMLNAQINDQKLNWKQVYNNESTTVHTCFPKVKNTDGTKDVVFTWKLTSLQEVSFKKCKEIISNIDLHKRLYDCKKSKLVNQQDSLSIAWYFFDSPWPVSDFDLVRTISSNYDKKNQTFTSKHVASPNAYKKVGYDRINVSEINYKLIKLPGDKVRFEIQGRFIPKGVPDFLAKSWFPKGPVKIVKQIVELSKD